MPISPRTARGSLRATVPSRAETPAMQLRGGDQSSVEPDPIRCSDPRCRECFGTARRAAGEVRRL